MGLCKCPRKRVTNLFCFEHRVNVCEHCLIENHSKCIVQSYLTWLQDSDYDSNCPLCGKTLCDESSDSVRLMCLHLFHWPCLDAWARRFPAHTAPAGYTCPTCNDQLFPKPNQVSPIVDVLKQKLSTANWARAGLGLALMPEFDVPAHPLPTLISEINQRTSDKTGNGGSTVLAMDVDPSLNTDHFSSHARKQFGIQDGSSNQPLLNRNSDMDNDENKYKRRSAFEWLQRWLKTKSLMGNRRAIQPWTCKRACFYLFFMLIAILTLVTVLSRLGFSYNRNNEDPLFDPMANPNIHVAEKLSD